MFNNAHGLGGHQGHRAFGAWLPATAGTGFAGLTGLLLLVWYRRERRAVLPKAVLAT